MIGAAGEWDCSNAYIRLREPDKSEDKAEQANVAIKKAKENKIDVNTRLREPDKSEDKAEQANVAIKKAKENKIDVNPATRWWRACMGVVVYLSIDQGKLLRKHRRVEAGVLDQERSKQYVVLYLFYSEE
ncbi:hypothetical protein BHE74_00031022 [Ensete ventricosum]|nr:hypothetical protein BHE74_00031022 [Ensete ventricosum]